MSLEEDLDTVRGEEEVVADLANEDEAMDDLTDKDDVVDEPSKKRKRDTAAEDELEIDVNLPEPPSKKALRKARKFKTSNIETSDATTNGNTTTKPSADAADGKPKITHSIWIGNLPFTTTKAMLRSFFTSSSSESPNPIADDQITRIHLPPPNNAKASRTALKPVNKGFAYVDLSTQIAFEAALALSETPYGGRNVLIKNAKDFAGRPDVSKTAAAVDETKGAGGKQKQVSRRVFVGNLGFDVTREDLEEHFAKCGEVESIHMATFEDTGKCKGFGWVTFAAAQTLPGLKSVGVEKGEDAAASAVKGFTWVTQVAEGEDEDDDSAEERTDRGVSKQKQDSGKKQKKLKPRKWFVNRLAGRPLRCEFAEDPTTRYKKRFGKDPEAQDAGKSRGDRRGNAIANGDVEQGDAIQDVGVPGRPAKQARKQRPAPDANALEGTTPGAPTDPSKRRGGRPSKAASADVRYRTGAIVEGVVEGKKVTFD